MERTKPVHYRLNPSLDNASLNTLFASAWQGFQPRDFRPVLARSLAYVGAFAGVDPADLIGFVNLAWDGGHHAFLLDTTVHASWQKQGIGRQLVLRVVEAARASGVEWVHVDYEDHLDGFYRSCGFQPTLAGLIRVGKA